jgi:hypothetical protein
MRLPIRLYESNHTFMRVSKCDEVKRARGALGCRWHGEHPKISPETLWADRSLPSRAKTHAGLFFIPQFMEPIPGAPSSVSMSLVEAVVPSSALSAPELVSKAAGSSVAAPVAVEPAAPTVEVRVAVVGNVDSGKSTLVGCLTKVRARTCCCCCLLCFARFASHF